MDIPTFVGGWSYTQKEMQELFKHIEYKDTYSILEFGSGDSTIKLYNHFKKYCKNVVFYTYESSNDFLRKVNGINYIQYNINEIETLSLPDIKFDLILIDGPNGDKRSLWYNKIKNNVLKGSIILVDDFNHYKCFSDELDKNFTYEILSHHEEPFVAYGEHSWKIVKVI